MNPRSVLGLALILAVVLAGCQTTPTAVGNPELDSVKAERDSLAVQLSDLQQKAASLARELDGLNSQTGDLTQTREELTRDRDALLQKTGSLEAAVKSLQNNLSQQSLAKKELEMIIASLKKEKDSLIALSAGTAAEWRQLLDGLTVTNQELQAKLATLQAERDGLANQLSEENKKLTAAVTQLRSQLRAEISRGDLEVVQYQNVLIVNIKDSILFAPDSAALKSELKPILSKVAEVFAQFPEKVIRVEGHTAIAPSRWLSSWDLGASRAVSVVRYFQESAKVDPSRLVALSFGEFRPLAPNGSEAERAKNRRVEIVLVDRPLYQVQELLQGQGKN